MYVHPQFSRLLNLSAPEGPESNEFLVGAEEAVAELRHDASAEYVTIYAALPDVLIHAILVPVENVTPPDIDDLCRCYFSLEDSWCIQRSISGQDNYDVYLEPPLSNAGCPSVNGAEKLIYIRWLEGLKGYNPPIELSQKLVHALGVHHLPERNAYSRLNDAGDFEDIIILLDDRGTDTRRQIVSIRSKELAEYLTLSGQCIVRLFDFTRVPKSFLTWPNSNFVQTGEDLFYNKAVGSDCSYVNGRQIIRTSVTKQKLIESWKQSWNQTNKSYETFLIHDWKNHRLVKTSCEPGSSANYFIESDLPFEVSPAFFAPEVLLKYKADPDKYEIRDRSITCRNAWHLKTYDVNDAGQISTYLVYLRDLPFDEQQHWKLHNERPKAPLSERAIKTDFDGEWDDTYDPLLSLKGTIVSLDGDSAGWWIVRGDDIRDAVSYPISTSKKEWADELLSLSQMVIEGFSSKVLKKMAIRLDAQFDKQWGSLKIIEVILLAKGTDEDEVNQIVDPLRYLQHLRSKIVGHATAEGKTLTADALNDHGSLKNHFRDLAANCDRSMESVVRLLKEPLPPAK